MDGSAGLADGGDLEDGWAAESAVREEDCFAESRCFAAGVGFTLDGDAAEVGEERGIVGHPGEGDEAGAGFDDAEAELAGDAVSEGGGAELGEGKAAGGNDNAAGAEGALGGGDLPRADIGRMGAEDGFDPAVGVDADADIGAFGFEHAKDLAGALVAEELAVLAFVPGDAVAFDQLEELGGGVAGEGGLWKVGAAVGDVVGGGGAEVGEIAAAAAGDEDLVSEAGLVFEDGDGAAVEAGDAGAEQSRGASAEDDDIEFVSHVLGSLSPGAGGGTRESGV